MAKSIYASANGLAQKVKKIYVGINGVARKVKKGYVGVNGIARLFFSSGLAYEGTAPDLRYPRYYAAAASTNKYFLIGGGVVGTGINNKTDNVDAYNEELTKSNAPALYDMVQDLAAGSVGGKAVFSGGYTDTPMFPENGVHCYDDDLTVTKSTLSVERTQHVAASLFDYVLFAGGRIDYGDYTGTVDAFDVSLTRSNPESISNARSARFDGASTGKRAIIGPSDITSLVDSYDNDLTRESAPNFPGTARIDYAAASVGDMVCFAGGQPNGGGSTQQLIAYTDDLTVISSAPLPYPARGLTGLGKDDVGIFAGGRIEGLNNEYLVSKATLVIDENLTCTLGPEMSVARRDMAKTVFGSYLIFAGGNTLTSSPFSGSGAVDIFSV